MIKEKQNDLTFVGTRPNGVYRPEITLKNLDISKSDKSKIYNDGFCDSLQIPFKIEFQQMESYQQMFCYLVDKVAKGFNDVALQPVNLFLMIDDNFDERQYYMGANVQIEEQHETRTETSFQEISLSEDEQAIVDLAVLKISNEKEFLLKYTRYQVGQRPEIVNRFGFFGDCILNDGSYRSTWIHEEDVGEKKEYTYLNICIPDVKNQSSKIEILPLGYAKVSA